MPDLKNEPKKASNWTRFPVVFLTALFCCILWGSASPAIKIFSRDENPVVLSGYQFAVGGAILAVIGAAMGGQLHFYDAGCVMNLLYLAFVSAGAYTLWGVLLKHNPVSRVSILGFMNPVMGVLLSSVFLGESNEAFSLNGLIALMLVSAGIILVNLSGGRKKQRAA